MTKVRTVFISAGSFPKEKCFHNRIEFALDKNLDEPARQYLEAIKSKALAQIDPSAPDLNDFFAIILIFEELLKRGRRPNNLAVNCLNEGIWEVKKFTARVTYFDVDSNGDHTPKEWNDDIRDLDPGDRDDDWQYPRLDEILRLATGFTKKTQRAPSREIENAKRVRKEDLAHG